MFSIILSNQNLLIILPALKQIVYGWHLKNHCDYWGVTSFGIDYKRYCIRRI